MTKQMAIIAKRSVPGERRRLRLSRAVCLCAGVTAAIVGTSAPVLAAEPAPPAAMAVTVAKVKSTCFADTMVVSGNVVPRNEILIRPDREGLQIKEILVEAGSTVAASAVLARLNSQSDAQTTVSLTAPVGGIILAAPTVVGTSASARGDPLFRIAAEGDFDLLAEVPAKQEAKLSIGLKATVKVAGMGESPGQVRAVSSIVDPTTQLGQMRISLARNAQIRVGTFARATVDLGQSCGPSIPLSALLFGPDGAVVQTILNNRIETRRVTVGLSDNSNVQIRDGLAEGNTIVVRAGTFLREGDRVRPVLARE